MAGLTAAQICAQARQTAKVPGFAVQSGQLLNVILQELCQDYDFQVARRTSYFNMDPSLSATIGGYTQGSGPYNLPADFLRVQDQNGVFYYVFNVPRRLQAIDLSQMDMMTQQPGLASYPTIFATDMSPLDAVQQGDAPPGVPQAYLWPPPSGAFPTTLRYFCQMPDIVTPETSAVIPWFPNQNYLLTRLAGELMRPADDVRMADFLGTGDEGAQGILNRYLKLKDDKNDRPERVQLDKMRFGRGTSNLPLSKFIGWGS